ncbi:prepilin-type N-terminal cleavage/methylation domain-containing protein [Desulforamulus putei DSM 12395]|uniref:Prepilin-type N-terminal cleavage/methylation domain-containing protein n=1 Tax=Desulforamulus putei DSM 12395 TaxID=1121429 RepID=A0A1M4UXT3_9FIRM|nr:prepilin-type N-terminal cleavage/methylation domain-containing protein [Desulforamulus putei]SHE61460.1 prepilin-type N-terminal cleavage/methylation domain-containing protein [Desulforamulus putei DSM 12395]
MPYKRLMGCCRKKLRNNRGFSLVELIIALALLSLVLAAAYQFYFFSQRSWQRAEAEAGTIQEARLAVMQLAREIRSARKATANLAAVNIADGVTPAGSQLDIYTDVNNDGKPERVCYRLQNGTLQRGVALRQSRQPDAFPYTYGSPATWQTVVAGVANTADQPVFSLKENYPNVVQINLIINADGLSKPVTVKSSLVIRSRSAAE